MTKILLIDDSTFSRNKLKQLLGSSYQFIEAPEGTTGLKVFDEEKPDLVILDLTMPGMDGLEVLEEMRKRDSQARVIIGSADIQEYNRLKAAELGAIDFINKPFQADLLTQAVKKALVS